ncbi:MAG: zinc ABC transporter substrate-binding protein [Alphaproteobacteria bacterium]|nr:zinc ABC transporter substrate-binding protein [Alphaproteobacteria bacterium]
MNRILSLIFFLGLTNFSIAAAPKVVVSIQPVKALVAGVMKGIGTPKLLLAPYESAHHFSLTPSEAEAIYQSDLFIWVGPQMENMLEKASKTLAINGRVLTLMDVKDMTILELAEGQKDPHLWLDPENAKKIVQATADTLASIDPDNAGIYQENAKQLIVDLEALKAKLLKRLDPLKGKHYLVYHDAFQYYEKAFGLNRSIPLVKDTEHTIRASQRKFIDQQVNEKNIQCVFGEPNHGESVVENVARALNLHVGFLNPMGSDDETNPSSPYFDMMEEIASSLSDCLTRDPK